MSAPHFFRRKKRTAGQIRRVRVRGKEYRDVPYKPQYALGIICAGEAEQLALHASLTALLPAHEIKVLVI